MIEAHISLRVIRFPDAFAGRHDWRGVRKLLRLDGKLLRLYQLS